MANCNCSRCRMPARVYIKREDYLGYNNKPFHNWAVRWSDDRTIYAYAMTWFGAWRLACSAVGWKVP